MHDRTNNPSENSSSIFEQRKHDHPQWVARYLDLADTALEQKKDEQDQAA